MGGVILLSGMPLGPNELALDVAGVAFGLSAILFGCMEKYVWGFGACIRVLGFPFGRLQENVWWSE